jgi:transposase
LKEPREPHRPPTSEALDDPAHQPPALSRLPAQEQLRQIYRLPADSAVELLDAWIAWARRCRLPSFVKLAKTITAQRAGIVAAIENRRSNARVEAINTQIRLITRRAFGFHSPDALIALAMLALADLCPPLPR